MNSLSKIDSIIFDLDGTLWDSAQVVADSWNEALTAYPQITRRLTKEDIYSVMGLTMTDIANRLFSEATETEKHHILEACCHTEHSYIRKHGGILFPHLEETLAFLSKSYRLFIVSNCQDGYIQSFFAAHHLDKYFEDVECWGVTKVQKGETIRILMNRNHVTNSIYVGDTQGDANACIVANIPFIYARYGFGHVDDYKYVIDSFSSLLTLLDVNN